MIESSQDNSSSIRSIADRPYLMLTVLALLVCICFFPVTKYFFLQDDFMLIEKAAMQYESVLTGLSGSEDGKFRPLTRYVYFALMHGVFGLNPVPYHIASFIFHILNVFLLYTLLMRFKLHRATSLLLTTVFALHVAFLNAIAWISCIQQLMAESFILLALNIGILAFERKSTRLTAWTSVFYFLALLCMEQSYAVPLLLFLYVYLEFEAATKKARLAAALRHTAPYLIILALYGLFMVGWREIPTEGAYAFSAGPNVWTNLQFYLEWVYNLSVVMPFATSSSRQA